MYRGVHSFSVPGCGSRDLVEAKPVVSPVSASRRWNRNRGRFRCEASYCRILIERGSRVAGGTAISILETGGYTPLLREVYEGFSNARFWCERPIHGGVLSLQYLGLRVYFDRPSRTRPETAGCMVSESTLFASIVGSPPARTPLTGSHISGRTLSVHPGIRCVHHMYGRKLVCKGCTNRCLRSKSNILVSYNGIWN